MFFFASLYFNAVYFTVIMSTLTFILWEKIFTLAALGAFFLGVAFLAAAGRAESGRLRSFRSPVVLISPNAFFAVQWETHQHPISAAHALSTSTWKIIVHHEITISDVVSWYTWIWAQRHLWNKWKLRNFWSTALYNTTSINSPTMALCTIEKILLYQLPLRNQIWLTIKTSAARRVEMTNLDRSSIFD